MWELMCRVSSWPWSLADINLAVVINIIIITNINKIDIMIFLDCLGIPLVTWSLADINLAIVIIIIITDITKIDIITNHITST